MTKFNFIRAREYNQTSSIAAPSDLNAALLRIAELEARLSNDRRSLVEVQRALLEVRFSHTWKAAEAAVRLFNRLLPRHGVLRRMLFGGFLRLLRCRQYLLRHRSRSAGLPELGCSYAAWMKVHEPSAKDLADQRSKRQQHEPLLTVAADLRGCSAEYCDELLQSMRQQTYCRWQFRLLAAGELSFSVALRLQQSAEVDPRIDLSTRGWAVDMPSSAAAAADGFGVFVQKGITLSPDALFEIVTAVNRQPQADLLYADEDHLDPTSGLRSTPIFKSGWSPDSMRSTNHLGELLAIRQSLLARLDTCGLNRDSVADSYDLALRAAEQAHCIVHIPKVLCHRLMDWRPAPMEPQRQALAAHLARLRIDGRVCDGKAPGTFRVQYRLPEKPLISIIIPNKDQVDTLRRCVDSVLQSSYESYEILVVENNSEQSATFAYYRQLQATPKVRILDWTRPFNYAAVNNLAVKHARGTVLLFLNNDVEVINRDWLECMLEHALRPEVGGVGAKLYFPDDTIQHAGVYVGKGLMGQPYRCTPRGERGYLDRLATVQNCSAVIAACLMMRREVFDEVGGFDEQYVLALNDIDLCMKVRENGYSVVWTPFAELYHWESKTRGYDDNGAKRGRFLDEASLFLSKWNEVMQRGDPYYSPHLKLLPEELTFRL